VDLSKKPESSFEELIGPFYPRIYRWALVITGDPDSADDVTQEAVIRAYRYFDTFRGESSLSTWLYSITRNVAVEMMSREAGREKKRDQISAEEMVAGTSGDFGTDDPDDRQLLEIVRSFFRELSARQREIFDLVDLQGYGPTEAAKMLGIDAATARTHLLRARRTIRSRIMDQYPELLEGAG
jgi:RNA polymerase sigma-70 factor (ECF subfamily)